MRSAVLILLLLTASGNAMAEWIAIGRSDSDVLYVDPSTIRATDNVVRLWALNDVVLPKTAADDPVRSEMTEYEYNCRSPQSRLLYFTSYSANMGQGEVVDFNFAPSDWMQISPGTGLEALWKIACGRA